MDTGEGHGDLELERLARRVAEGRATEAEKHALRVALSECRDAARLRALATDWAGDPEVALPVLERALALDPEDAKAHARAGWVRFSLGEDERARRHAERALEIAPSDPDPLLLLACVIDDVERARRLCERVLWAEPDNEVAKERLEALLRQGGSRGP